MITKEQVSDLRSFSDAVMQRTLDSTRALQDLKIAQTQLENFLYKLEHDEAVPAYAKDTQWNDLKTKPEHSQQVIVWNTGCKQAETATFKDGKFLDHTGIHVNLTNVVSHWQPITTVAPKEIL
jgi:hypothetical protein